MKKDKKFKFLICRIDRIGDVVLSTPLPREIKKKFPDAFVSVLVRKYTRDIYLNNPNVDEIIIYDEEKSVKSFWQMVRTLRKYKFDFAFMLLPDERLNYILFFSGIKTRIGVGHKLYQFLTFTKYVDRKKYIEERHEADYSLDMLRKIGIEPETIEPEIYLSEEEKIIAQNFKKEIAPNNESLIGVNSTSGNSSPNLTYSEYRKLIEKLAAIEKFKVIVTDLNPPDEIKKYSECFLSNDKRYFAGIHRKIFSIRCFNFFEHWSDAHLRCLESCRRFLFFCSLPACSPKLWGSLGNKSVVILPKKSIVKHNVLAIQKFADTKVIVELMLM